MQARQAVSFVVPVALLALGFLSLAAFGLLGVGRGGGEFAFDMPYLFTAGEMWEDGASPYGADFKARMNALLAGDPSGYAYPPSSAPLALLLSSGSIDAARIIIATLDVAAIWFLVFFICRAAASDLSDPSGRAAAHANLMIAAAVVIGNPFTAHVIWMGQTTLVSGALVMGCWLLADRRSDLLAGVLLGLSAVKPQLAFLVGFWFLLDRRWTLILAAAATTVVMSLWPIVATGFGGSWLAWFASLRDYAGTIHNTVTFRHVFGLRSAFAAAGVELPSLMPLAMLCVFLLYCVRRNYENIWLVTAILLVSFLMLFAHDYDLAPATIIAYPLLRAARGRTPLLLAIALLALILFFPQRIWERADLGELARSREVALLALLAIYLTICRVTAHRPYGTPAAAFQ